MWISFHFFNVVHTGRFAIITFWRNYYYYYKMNLLTSLVDFDSTIKLFDILEQLFNKKFSIQTKNQLFEIFKFLLNIESTYTVDSVWIWYHVLGGKSSSSLMCYSERSGTKMQNCHSSFGFKTCFTKYNYSKYSHNLFEHFKLYNGCKCSCLLKFRFQFQNMKQNV